MHILSDTESREFNKMIVTILVSTYKMLIVGIVGRELVHFYAKVNCHWPSNQYQCLFFLLPPANEVWGKVIFSQASVCPH